jgi:hypothetical protein
MEIFEKLFAATPSGQILKYRNEISDIMHYLQLHLPRGEHLDNANMPTTVKEVLKQCSVYNVTVAFCLLNHGYTRCSVEAVDWFLSANIHNSADFILFRKWYDKHVLDLQAPEPTTALPFQPAENITSVLDKMKAYSDNFVILCDEYAKLQQRIFTKADSIFVRKQLEDYTTKLLEMAVLHNKLYDSLNLIEKGEREKV